MKDNILENLNKLIQAYLVQHCGYAGVAVGPKDVMINSGANGKTYIIKIEDKSEE